MAMTNRYVSTSGAGAHDGTSEANAYSWSEMLTAISGGAAAGYVYNVKQGTYTVSATSTISAVATATSPLVIRGYKTTIGDATRGFSSGALDTSNMPTIAFDANFRWNNSGIFIVLEALVITANNNGYAVQIAQDGMIHNCRIVNSSTGGGAYTLGCDEARCVTLNCELGMTGASGGLYVVNVGNSGGALLGCRIFQSQTHGISAASASIIVNNVVQGCAGDGIQRTDTGGSALIYGNTVQGCTGDGVDIIASSTVLSRVIGNHLTDNGGYGCNFNGTSGAVFLYNRTRDNTSGATSGATDWVAALATGNVTTDNGSASSDYTNAGSGDCSLVSAAVALQAGISNKLPIGACGPASVSAGGLRGTASA